MARPKMVIDAAKGSARMLRNAVGSSGGLPARLANAPLPPLPPHLANAPLPPLPPHLANAPLPPLPARLANAPGPPPPKVPVTIGVNDIVPDAPVSFRAGANPAGTWSAGYGSAAAVGGMLGMMADPENKGMGFMKGAAGGMIGGKAFRTFSRKGAGVSSSLFNGLDSRLGGGNMGSLSRGWGAHKGVVRKGLAGFHSTQGRHNMFRSGAMLGGGAFGVMFASNGRSHKRGFNSQRGNSFSR